MCEWTDHTSFHKIKTDAEVEAGQDIVAQPLYAAPQPANGWLTPEDQAAILFLIGSRSQFSAQTQTLHEARRNAACRVCHSLLDRSTPPEVVLPVYCGMPKHTPIIQGVWDDCISRVKAALAAAGVTWKEVGRE
jgi:hypothetical protein